MIRLIIAVLLSLLFCNGFSQHHHDGELSCSKAKFYEEYFKSTKDVIQTPLLFDYDVKFYFLDILVDNSSIYISGEVTIMAEVVAAELDTFALELLNDLTIDEVLYNGDIVDSDHFNDEVFIYLPEILTAGENISVKVKYHGTPPTGGFFSGVSNSNGWGKDVTWTLSEPFAARSWFPVKQVLEDKADSAWIFLTTDENNMAGSNGLLTNITPMPDDKLRYEWKTNYPIAFYLISFAVSEYQEYNIYTHPEELGGDSVLIQNFIYDSPGCLDYYKDDIDQTASMIELYSELFSLYPFHEEKYGHCLTELGGGMEHQTMTTIGGFNFGLVAHELGHMWFGDNITCATWSDIWINEGFATYADYLAVQNLIGQSAANAEMNSIHTSVMSQPGGSTYIPSTEITYENVWRIFDARLSYNKGAAILHMIRYELQDDNLFFEVLHEYTEQFSDSVATGLDFMNVLNDVSGMDFTDFFNQWYFGEGYPTYSIVWNHSSNTLNMEITQTVSAPSVTPVFKMLMAYKLLFYDNTDTIIYLYQTDNLNTFSIPLSSEKEIGLIQIDPENWVVNKTGSIVVSTDDFYSSPLFSLKPNPVKNVLNINFSNSTDVVKSIYIYDLSGLEIKTMETFNNSFTLDVSDLPAGSYLLKTKINDRWLTRKFIKQD